MKIKSIHIKDFKSISELHFQANPKMNVIIGLNGAGKSTLLQGIKYLLSWYINRFKNPKSSGIHIDEKEIRQENNKLQPYSSLSVELNKGVYWQLSKNRPYQNLQEIKSDFSQLNKYLTKLRDELEEIESLPIITYYDVNRIVNKTPSRFKKSNKLDVLSVYDNALEAGSNFRAFFEWFREREDIENEKIRDNYDLFFREESAEQMQQPYRDPALETVRYALSCVLPGYGEIKIRRNPREIIIEKASEHIRFDQLSDGEKCFITLVGDIARRLAIANPNNPKAYEGEGIILIDEIDLHLHPEWQITVIDRLRTTFPNCQFFITTHSPFVVNNIRSHENEKLLCLENGREVYVAESPFGMSIDRVLSSFFNVSTFRNEEIEKRFENLNKLLSQPVFEVEEFDKQMKWVKEHLGESDLDYINYTIDRDRRLKE